VTLNGAIALRQSGLQSSPLNAKLDLDMPSLAWARVFQEGLETDGQLQMTAQVQGTIDAPQLQGQATGSHLLLSLPTAGIVWKDGELAARLQGEKLWIDTLRIAGGAGTLGAQGSVGLRNGTGSLAYEARNFTALSQPDREAVVTGAGVLTSREDKVVLEGGLSLNRARIELTGFDRPSLGNDVVVVGANPDEEESNVRKPLPLKLSLALGLGDDFKVKGRGVSAKLEGSLGIRGASGRVPRAYGTVNVVDGVVEQFGQSLEIERGAINFNGSIDNPGLNITARRKRSDSGWMNDADVNVSARIAGTLAKPKVNLVSTPEVPDSEKLAWLVLGHGLQDTQGNELAVLSAAANALLARDDSESLQSKIAGTLGVEELGVRRDTTQQMTFATLGKRLSSRAYLTLEQALGGAASLAKLRYKLTGRWSLQATTGTESAIDLFYNWRFD
jgi:translocation and assembly module TamB